MMEGVKLLMLSWNFPPAMGGIENMVESLFRGLRRRGHEVRIVTSGTRGAPAEEGVHRATRPGLPAYVAASFLRGWALCRAEKPDFILCGSLVSAPAGWALSRLFRRPWGVTLYGSDLAIGGRVYRTVVRFLLRRADSLFPISRHTASLAARFGVDMNRAAIIPPGVRTEPFDRPPTEGAGELLDACRGKKVILTVGRLVRRKGVLEFVRDVMPTILQRHPDALFLAVGEDAAGSLIHRGEGMRARIEAVIGEKGLGESARLLGSLDEKDLIALYFRADVFVLPGLDLPGDVEGFGIVFSEAALAGVPLAATRTGGVPDAVEDGVTGLLVPPGQPAALAEAVSRLLSDEALRARLGRAAAERARTVFAWDVIVRRYEEALATALARRGVTPAAAATGPGHDASARG